MAGQTTQLIDYYTSAGVEAVDISPTDDPKDKKVEYRITAEARKMRIANSAYLSYAGQRNVAAIGEPGKYVEGQPSTEIRSIRWIDNDETQGLNPYYVMTGTNGSIYRMYTFSSEKAEIFAEQVKTEFPNIPVTMVDPLSLSVACHIGSGAIALAMSRTL
jgi:hypothetical protein